MANDASPFLNNTRQKAGDVFKGHQWNVECITRSNEPCGFDGSVDVQAPSQNLRLVSYDTDGASIQTCKTNDDVVCIGRKEFDEGPIVNDLFHHFDHVVWLVWIVRHNVLKGFVEASNWIACCEKRRVCHVVVWQVGENGRC